MNNCRIVVNLSCARLRDDPGEDRTNDAPCGAAGLTGVGIDAE
jgi:hypothetical protein